MRRKRIIALAVLIVLAKIGVVLFVASRANENIVTDYALQKIRGGLHKPTSIVQPSDGTGRLFITEQTGAIRIVSDGQLFTQPFLDVTALLTSKELEQGLLDIAFHPNYASNGLFFITYTDPGGRPTLARYHVSAGDPNVADPASARILLVIPHPYTNHNGGQIQFGPDGYLYYGMGDGGNEGDPLGNGQRKESLLGSMMRLDVDHGDLYSVPPDNPFIHDPNYRPEIWAKGLRNPWRFSFDQQTGDLYIADVGGSLYEEIDFQPSKRNGGENYGWNLYEGMAGTGPTKGLIFPVTQYDHITGGCAVVGGYVYRGKTLPGLVGTYLYGDFCKGTIWGMKRSQDGVWHTEGLMSTGVPLTTFGQSTDGEIYAADINGSVYKLVVKVK
jgi:glucose/arabinose dehydrogenase